MRNVRASIRVEFFAQLPDGDQADDAFDRMLEEIQDQLMRITWRPTLGICDESFTVRGGDTEPDE